MAYVVSTVWLLPEYYLLVTKHACADFRTGLCACGVTYGSGDGEGSDGQLGDCGYVHTYYGFLREEPAHFKTRYTRPPIGHV